MWIGTNSNCFSSSFFFFRLLYLPSSRTISRRWLFFLAASVFASSCGGVGAVVVVPFCIKNAEWMNVVACCVASGSGIAEHLFLNKRSTEGVFGKSLLKVLSLLCIASVSRVCCNGQQRERAFQLVINWTRGDERGCVCVLILLIFCLIKWYGLMPNKLRMKRKEKMSHHSGHMHVSLWMVWIVAIAADACCCCCCWEVIRFWHRIW